ncbi:MAG: DNA polymerase III subunit gamma/tau [Candidatus Sungbacteria bacterium]|uniref:DNA polymerase III subunit gamma/tau n=1 Tax=Candidatus Sungiibacteriota bacterium TaxID=2750080 RepID=A0A932YXZ6_9BACT|nr:DNA polymerase III subunit gamma/tau [Candidatus Sungbacteria bacterium]
MSYQVLYRKYRPKDFSEVVGQDHIISVLRRQVENGRVAHAYLFSGPRGIGKTTVARLIAKAVNCANAPSATVGSGAGALSARRSSEGAEAGYLKKLPCNTCESCLVFNQGQALNLIEIDAASNRGIDEIRELREAVRFLPPSGGTKVYVIDEVHQLTKEAFNALLKTLEEPPAHVVFVLATTELEKVPPTIVSRTQHFDFRRPRSEVIRDRITAIAKNEGVTLEPDAAATIAFVAEGSVRDAESLLGKIMAVEDARITPQEVEDILGIPERQALVDLFQFIGRRQAKEAIALVNRLYQSGFEMDYLTKILISFFRDALLMKTDPALGPAAGSRAVSGSEGDFAEHLDSYTADDLASAIVAFIEALAMSRRSPIPQLPLELAIINIIHGPGATKI